MLKLSILFCSLIFLVSAKNEIYDGHSLYEITVQDIEEAKTINKLEDAIGIDVWSHALPKRPGLVLVSKEMKHTFESMLEEAGIQYKLEEENIKRQLDLEDELIEASKRRNNGTRSSLFPFDEIHRYEVIDEYLVELGRLYPETVTVVSGGRSFEGRDIKYLKISSSNFQVGWSFSNGRLRGFGDILMKACDQNPRKPVVMMQSLLHCREWIGLPATLYAIHKLVIDVTDRDLIENIDWIIIPIANPDGFEHTHTSSRFWRKNRATDYMVGNICSGVDLNRNFDMLWGTASSSSVCSETFHGSHAFSEPESAIIREIMAEHRGRLELFLDIHSFGSWILYGYGNGTLPNNGLLVHLVGVTMAEHIDPVKLETNPNYVVGNVFAILYAASGSAQDYAQANGVSYSYTFELPAWRNQGSTLNGFLVDPEFIPQAGYETWEGIKAGARAAANLFQMRNRNF